MKNVRTEKYKYSEKTFEEADKSVAYWKTRPMWERLQAAYHLSLRAYGYDPDHSPSFDKTVVRFRKLQ